MEYLFEATEEVRKGRECVNVVGLECKVHRLGPGTLPWRLTCPESVTLIYMYHLLPSFPATQQGTSGSGSRVPSSHQHQ